ncbi:MAG TPA: GspE/PulE family protein [Dokdonella sp.]
MGKAATEATTAAERARVLGLEFLGEDALVSEQAALDQVPAELAREGRLLPLKFEDGRLHVAMADPTDSEALGMLSFLCKQAPVLKVATPAAIERAIARVYSSLNEDVAVLDDAQPVEAKGVALQLEKMAQEAPIVRLVNNILAEAMRRGASDIHVRPGARFVELVFRIDGDLTLMRRFTKALLPAVVARIKVMGRMDITQHRLPQDWQARIRDDKRTVDLRISVIPTIEGESVVIRLLNPSFELGDIHDLGLAEKDSRRLGELLERTAGLVLVTGPTGSGKSTTLYAALKTVISRNVNVITVENPVEYRIPGVEQVPVATEQGLTFAKALRNILRHDPDVIMVGEIRDAETAHIAIESGLTGHLVLSTLHTNSAVGTMSRLLEMGIDDYLVRATLLAIMAQRLVRKICPACREPDEPGAELRVACGADLDEPFMRGAGCAECQNRGYRGRRMTYELLTLTPELRRLIRRGIDADAVQTQAIADGMLPLTRHALSLARAGEISLTEAYLTRID